jgi:methyl-accepting chemotaxis protein
MNHENKSGRLSLGRRIWLWSAIIISGLVFFLAAAGVVGAWVGRSEGIRFADRMLDGVYELAGAGRQGVTRLNEAVGDLLILTAEVELATAGLAQSVADRGVVVTLLPPEKEQELADSAQRLGDTVDAILDVVRTAVSLAEAIDSLPFVNLPKPEETELQAMQQNAEEIGAALAQLAADIQAFRDGVATEIGRVVTAVNQVDALLTNTQQSVSETDNALARVQTHTQELKQTVRQILTIVAIALTLLLSWIMYALVVVIRQHWHTLHSPAETIAILPQA